MIKSEGQTGLSFPVAIGGVGGSGTRVVAEVVGQLGYFLGGDLNNSIDNLWYSLLFKRRGIVGLPQASIDRLALIFTSAMSGQAVTSPEHLELVCALSKKRRYGHEVSWLTKRADSLCERLGQSHVVKAWAWKEPNTHVIVEKLTQQIPNLRYIHVVRDGRDMAYSQNRNQLYYWADTLFGMPGIDYGLPSTALHYWRLANERIVQLKRENRLPILEVGFEALCQQPVAQIMAIAKFCNAPISMSEAQRIAGETIHAPESMGRYREMDHGDLDPGDCRYAEETAERLTISAVEA